MSSSKSSHIPMSAGFLSLAPTTSTGYPLSQKQRTTSSTSTISDASTAAVPLTTTALAAAATATALPVAAEAPNKARTESLSSDGSKSGSGLRYLKLGPVHQGAHLDGKGDWHDVAVDE